MGKRIALLNNKGGVGKTLAAVGLAEAAARVGAKVLVVDMDPQANATRRLAAVPSPEFGESGTLTDCLRPTVKNGDAKKIIVGSGWDGSLPIWVLRSDLDLEDRVLEAGQPGAPMRLRKALFGVDDHFDLTIIDCPPSIKGQLTMMAITALDGIHDTVLVPLTPEYDAVGGARRAVDYVRLYREDLGVPTLEVSGLIVNAVRPQTVLHTSRIGQLSSLLPHLPVLAEIPLRARLAEVQDAGRPLASDPELKPILDEFHRLAERLLQPEPA